MSNKTVKFAVKMKELQSFLRKEARNNNRNYETLLLGAMNGVLAYHSLMTDTDASFHTDIINFEDMLDCGKYNTE